MLVTLCVLLWARPEKGAALVDYENSVLALLVERGGEVLQRARTSGADDEPIEIQLLRFASESALDDFMNDPRRLSLAPDRDAAVARTDVYRVDLVEAPR